MKNVIVLILMLLPLVSFSQKEAAIWYFGQYAGLDFNSGIPVVLTDGQIDAYEGCATISDTSGNLLFYTDGVRVWDNTHNIMPNGNGLLGNTSSTQSAIIVPKPNNVDQYYIFTVDDNPNGGSSNGINYSMVDITLNSGLGDVVSSEKNRAVINSAYENITAIKHANNNSYWVISFIRDTFYAWLVDATGVNTTPVTSTASTTLSSIGYLKIAPDGTKIASANYGTSPSLMLYDFDASNGIVSNEIQLSLDQSNDIPYGVEFSLQNTKLYVATDKLEATGRTTPSKIIQYDLTSANVSNSRTVIHTSNTNTRGALQLAIDGKIYRAQSVSLGFTQAGTHDLGVINNPDALGTACNYVHDAIDISNGDAFRNVVEGLPPFIQSFFLEPTISANEVCLGTPTQFILNSSTPPTSITWDFGDPSTGLDNTSADLNPTHLFSSAGVFTITAIVTIGTITTNLSIDVTIYDAPTVNSPVTLIQCDDDTDGIVNFNLEEASSLISANYLTETITFYTDSLAAVNADSTFLIANPITFSNAIASTVWARVVNTTSCATVATINLEVANTDIPDDLMLHFYECDILNGTATFDFSTATNQVLDALLPETGFTITYYETMADALAEQNAIDETNYTNTTPNTQQIVVRADDINNDCFGLGFHVTLNIEAIPEFDLASTISFCETETPKTISVENPAGTYTYLWEDEMGNPVGTTQSININTIGLYTVTAGISGTTCSNSKSIQVTFNPTPIVNSPVTLIQCDDDSDDIVDFNLEEANSLISANYLTETITYYTDSLAAVNADNTFLIANPTTFSNATASTVWATVENTTSCTAVATINLEVANTDIPDDLMLHFYECDDNFGTETDGIAQFDFTSATNDILDALLPETNLTVAYYETIPDALAEQNAINTSNYANTISPFLQQIVVRVDNTNNDCFGLGYHVTLNVNPVPVFDLPNSATLCLGAAQFIQVENPNDIYDYEWQNNANSIVGNTGVLEITEEGIYTVTATDTNGNNCATSKSIEIFNKPTGPLLDFSSANILITDNSSNNTITVITDNLPVSNYEFALDSGEFQPNNIFENVSGGIHYVHIQDVENCLEATEQVSIIYIPNFFTPNNDGINDYWQVSGVDFQPNTNIYIFDRFGKLLKKLNPLSPGWDGFYKGNPLPSTDYWYKVELEDGRVFKGHFSLIRRD